MKTNQVNQLKEAIRAIIRQETKSIIQEEVSKAMGKVLVEMVKEIKKPLPTTQSRSVVNEAVELEELSDIEESATEVSTIKTNNPLLNSALADTARTFRGMPRLNNGPLAELAGDFEKVGGGDTGIEEPMTNMNFMKQMVAESAGVGPAPQSVLDCKNELPDHLAKLFSGKNLGQRFKKVKELAGNVMNNGQVGIM